MSFRLAGLVASMTAHSQRLWDELDDALNHASARGRLLAAAQTVCDTVERLCREAGEHPGTLPIRSRDCYAWFSLLSSPENLQLHLEALQCARMALHATGVSPGTSTAIVLQPMQSLWRANGREPVIHRFLEVFAVAPKDFWVGFFQAFHRGDLSRARVLLRTMSSTAEATEFMAEMDDATLPDEKTVAGNHYHLNEVFDRVNANCFQGTMTRPTLRWTRGGTRRTFGHYQFARDRLSISRSLDSPRVPAFVIDFIMFHELLHKVHGLTPSGGRLYAHTRAFRSQERTFPRIAEAERELARLARRMRQR